MKLSSQYVAGLFDGEGWVRVDDATPAKRLTGMRFQLTAGIAMTHKPAMELIQAQYGGNLYGDDSFRLRYDKNRTIYRWQCASRIAAAFLRDVLPYLIVKQDQAELAILFQDDLDQNRHLMVGNPKDLVELKQKEEFRAEKYAFRRDICDQLRAMKKVNYNLVKP